MSTSAVVLCPDCGAHNRPSWAYCARCQAALEGAQRSEAPDPEPRDAPGSSRPAIVLDAPAGSAASPRATVAAAVAVAVALFGAAWGWRDAPASEPAVSDRNPASLFTIGTQPAELPRVPPDVDPGAAEYAAGLRLRQRGDAAGAVVALASAVLADPGSARYREAHADALWEAGDREAALAEYAEAAQLDPGLRIPHARALDRAGRSEEAIRQYQSVLEDHPEHTVVRVDLGRLLFRSGRDAPAAPLLTLAVETRPGDPVLRQELAYSLDKAGDREAAMAAYRQVLAMAPQAALSRALLADGLVAQGKTEDALALLDEGLQATPRAPLLHRQRGAVLESMGLFAEAAAEYRTYRRLAPNAEDAADLASRAARLEAGQSQP